MHEMSLCENLVQIIEQQAEIENFHRVRTVFLDIGVFAGVEIDSLHFCLISSARKPSRILHNW